MNYLQPEPHVVPKHEQRKVNRKLILIGVLILIFILCVIAALLLIWSLRKYEDQAGAGSNTGNEQTAVSAPASSTVNQPETQSNVAEVEPVAFTGSYVKAQIPSGWTIVEYSTADGMHGYAELPSITGFSGLTGLEVVDNQNRKVFSINGVDGIGGSGFCTTIGKFADTSDGYIQQILNAAAMYGEVETQVQDLTTSSYSSLNFFGHNIRRVDGGYYIKDPADVGNYNPLCGISAQFLRLNGLKFTIVDSEAGNYSIDVYKFGTVAGLDEGTYLQLDQVLNSLEAI